jgi:MYXO-CTERM domain-containing protein
MRARSGVLGVFLAVPVLLAARVALGAPAQIHTVFWQQDTSVRASVDAFFTCLTESSTFATTWIQEFGINSVTYEGSYVLTSAAPAQVTLGGNLDQLMNAAFASGALPAPQAGVEEEYLVYWPPTITAGDDMGATLCSATGPCAEHHPFAQYNGITYDLALVPISCNMCAMGLAAPTIGGEHEAAEGISDLAGNQYEVGDDCEMDLGTLTCCGQSYAIQELAGNTGPTACQPISVTGSGCVMPPEDAGSPSPPEAGSGSDEAGSPPADAGGGRGGGSGGSGVDAGAPSSNDASGVTSGDGSVRTANDDAGGSQDAFGGGSTGASCGCVLAGGPSDESAQAIVVIVGLLIAALRSRRRDDA